VKCYLGNSQRFGDCVAVNKSRNQILKLEQATWRLPIKLQRILNLVYKKLKLVTMTAKMHFGHIILSKKYLDVKMTTFLSFNKI
jgi:hypothetical protein